MRVVVVGGGAAGASAAARAKRINPNSEVVLIEATNLITHGPCGIPYALSGIVRPDSLYTYTPEEFERERGVKVLVNTEVIRVDVDRKVVTALRNGKHIELSWDRLVLATGAMPAIPKVAGIDLNGVIAVRHPAYVNKIIEVLSNASNVAVVGGSYLGLELVESLLMMGKRVLLFELTNQLLPTSLDADTSLLVLNELLKKGVEIHLNEALTEIKGNSSVKSLITDKGEYKVDAVVLATGVRPNTKLAKDAGIELGPTGAIKVNEYMETNVEDVYAAGDAAEKVHRITGKNVWIPLAPTANKEGQVAGANAVGGRLLKFPGILGTAITKFFDLYIARTGLTEKEAKSLGIKCESRTITSRTKAHYYPGSSEVHVKLVINSQTTEILGAQILGYDPIVAGYIDVVATVITNRMTIEDLFFTDLSYMPATAPVWHPLIVASRVLSKGRF